MSTEHTVINEVTPIDQSSKCNKCQLPVVDDKVKCNECGESVHGVCIGLKASSIDCSIWKCENCSKEDHAKGGSKDINKASKSKSSSSRGSSVKRAALQRLEEERKLNEELLKLRLTEMAKINKEYLDKKYAIEIESASDDDEVSLNSNEIVVNKWLDNAPKFQAIPKNIDPVAASTSVPRPIHNADIHNFSRKIPETCSRITQEQIAARQAGIRNLPTFSGEDDCDNWPAFINSYYSTTEKCGFDNSENLVRLLGCLKGEAKEAVKALLILPGTVPQAISVLEMLYGQPERIINSLLKKLRSFLTLDQTISRAT